MPEELGMGWGIEMVWASYADIGLRLGIVDAAGMRHLHRVAEAYSVSNEAAIRDKVVAAYGFVSMTEVQDERGRWRLWQRSPPWLA